MFEQKAVGSLVVPFWPSSSFWPLISRIYANFIVDHRVFSGDGSLEHGRNVNALLGSKRFKGSVMALRLILFQVLKHHEFVFAGFVAVVDQYCFYELISTALANGDTVWHTTCVGSALRNGTGLWLLHVSGPMALAWPSQTLVLGYISGCKQL